MLVRHLPTLDDANGIYTPPDSNVGFAAIDESRLAGLREEISAFVHAHNIQHVYCSSNQRGVKTAEILFDGLSTKCKIAADSALGNMDQPEWGNQPQSYVKTTDKYRLWHSNPSTVQFEGGESLQDVERRIDKFLDRTSGQSAIIVSHTTPMQVLLCKLIGIDVDRIWCFEFEHYRLTAMFGQILLRYNAAKISDINFEELKL